MTIRLSDYETILFFTGAGVSAESGVPTYRGAGGVWKEYDYHRFACQEAFDEDPERVWEFHNYRRELVGKCQPNAAHELIARLQRERGPEQVRIVTQNIDGLHQLAGAQEVFELHGSLWRVRCDACGRKRDDRSVPFTDRRCGADGSAGTWRPDITWFGDALDQEVFGAAVQAALKARLIVTIGTSGVVYPAAQIPLLGRRSGAVLVEVNPEETELSGAHDHCLRGSASEVLPTLV